jgi:predicted  nucleic acid-binding Zn-ribbon protein
MSKLPVVVQKLARIVVCASLATPAFVGLVGCGSSEEQADKAAKAAVADADIARAKAQESDDRLTALDSVQHTYDTLANSSDISPQMKVLLRGRQSQLRLELIGMRTAQLRQQELAITGDIAQINQLAMQVAGSQAAVAALKSYEPTDSVNKLSAQRDLITGSADKLTWTMPNPSAADPNGVMTSPTVFAIKQEIQDLTAKIQQNQSDTDAARKLSAAKGDEAEQYTRRAEGETGKANVDDVAKAAGDRRDAAYADARAGSLANDLARLQANLDRAKDQQSALEAAVKALDDQIQALNTRWASVKDQIDKQKDIQTQLINGSTGRTIFALGNELSKNVQDAGATREKINDDINTVVSQLTGAITTCNQLRQDWVTSVREKQDDPDAIIWKQAQETLHPFYFNLQVASALETRATIAANRARIDQLIYDMWGGHKVDAAEIAPRLKSLAIPASTGPIDVPGLTSLFKNAGIDIPKGGLSDVPPPDSDQLAQRREEANKAFQDAIDAYEKKYASTDTGPAAIQRTSLALSGEAHADRAWSEFAAFFGDAAGAKGHLDDAQNAESQIDPSFTQAANAVTAPGTTPPAGAAPAGAPRTPAGGVQ